MYDEFQQLLTIKTLSKLGLQGTSSTYNYKKPASSIFNSKILNAVPLISRTRQECHLPLFICKLVLQILDISIKQYIKIKGINTEKKNFKR